MNLQNPKLLNPLLVRLINATGTPFLLSDEAIEENNNAAMNALKEQAEAVREFCRTEPFCHVPQFANAVVTIGTESRCTSCCGKTYLLICIQPFKSQHRKEMNRICRKCWLTALNRFADSIPDEEVQS